MSSINDADSPTLVREVIIESLDISSSDEDPRIRVNRLLDESEINFYLATAAVVLEEYTNLPPSLIFKLLSENLQDLFIERCRVMVEEPREENELISDYAFRLSKRIKIYKNDISHIIELFSEKYSGIENPPEVN